MHFLRTLADTIRGGGFMKRLKKNTVLFTSGGVGYGLIELLWRGRTHWSMIVAGGLCFVMFAAIAKKWRHRSLVFKAGLCALGVTAVEFVFGVIFNLILRKNVWDYSDVPLNILGQVCPLYTVLWGILALGVVPLAEKINKRLEA